MPESKRVRKYQPRKVSKGMVNLQDPERRTPRTDPFSAAIAQGMARAEILRLLGCRNKPAVSDRRKYEGTEWFRALKAAAIHYFGSCVLCEAGKNLEFEDKLKRLVIHHRNYRHWFDESMSTDITLLCTRCHGRYHRGHRK
jgi:hypothetical protein